MPAKHPRQDACLGVSFYRTRHRLIREGKRLHAPSTYGYRVWNSCWLLMDYLKTLGLPPGLRVMDVGCGWGLAGIFCASQLRAQVTCVDADPEVFHYLRLHAELNRTEVATRTMRIEQLTERDLSGLDLLIGADICFWDSMPDRLLPMIDRALSSGVKRIIMADPGRMSFEDLAATCTDRYGAKVFTLSVRKPQVFTGRLLVITGQQARPTASPPAQPLIAADRANRQEQR